MILLNGHLIGKVPSILLAMEKFFPLRLRELLFLKRYSFSFMNSPDSKEANY